MTENTVTIIGPEGPEQVAKSNIVIVHGATRPLTVGERTLNRAMSALDTYEDLAHSFYEDEGFANDHAKLIRLIDEISVGHAALDNPEFVWHEALEPLLLPPCGCGSTTCIESCPYEDESKVTA